MLPSSIDKHLTEKRLIADAMLDNAVLKEGRLKNWWSLKVVSGTLVCSLRISILAVVDDFTRESPALGAGLADHLTFWRDYNPVRPRSGISGLIPANAARRVAQPHPVLCL